MDDTTVTEVELELISASVPPEQTEELKTPLSFEDLQPNATTLQHNGYTLANPNGGLSIDANGGLSANGPSLASVEKAQGKASGSGSVGFGGRRRWVKEWQRVEFVALCIAIVAVWGLLCLPIIFYQMPPDSNDSQEGQPQMNSTSTCMAGNQRCDAVAQGSGVCSSSIVYSGSICRSYLQEFQSCLSGREGSGDVYIAPQGDQVSVESQANTLITVGLPIVTPSVQCEEAIRPFLCLYLFRLCDGGGGLYEPSCGQCVSIRDDICAREWIAANELLQRLRQPMLPVCEEFPDPMGSNAGSGFMTDNGNSSGQLMVSSDIDGGSGSMQPQPARNCSTIQCSDGFYCTPGAISICRPRCDTWEQYPHTTVVLTDVCVILSVVIGLVAGVAVLVISGIRWKKVFTFPSVFAIYLTITLVVFALFVLISYMDRPGLFCSSMDLAESVDNSSPFCTIAGIVFYYTLLQEGLWWFIHVVALFWKVIFPFHARSFQTAHWIKYIHITGVVIALVLPIVPVIVNATIGGFGLVRFPPLLCTGRNANATFYSLIVPIIVLMQIGITLLLIMIWAIHKQQGLFRATQSKSPFKLGTAEKKLLIVFCYYVVLGVIALTTFTLSTRNAERVSDEALDIFKCEAPGTGAECPLTELKALTFPWLNTISFILLGLFPAINLIFAVNVGELKQFCSRATRYHFASSTQEHSSTGSTTAAISIIRRFSMK